MSRFWCRLIPALIFFVFAALPSADSQEISADSPIEWQGWSESIFDQAKKEDKFVLLNLEAVWCHWCHVMADTTYRDAKVAELMRSKYIAVRVDQDARPDISVRYEKWGWPATIIFSKDGEEIVKRRGYIPPEAMASLLDAVIKDPSPGPSVIEEAPVKASEKAFLSEDQKNKLEESRQSFYDKEHGGWGTVHKLIDADNLELAILRAEDGVAEEESAARQTLDGALNLLDPHWGGFYQYSDARDWKSPHYEKLISVQADYARLYSLAYSAWAEPRYYEVAKKTLDYVLRFLTGSEGAFYVSQDADVDSQFNGFSFYSLKDEERLRLGRLPKVDTHLYARENGWMIRALAAFYDATGEERYLGHALKAAEWVLANRKFDQGGFRHDAEDPAGPYLGDTLSMGQAFLSLYESTADRQWLIHAQNAADMILKTFKKDKDSEGGYHSSIQDKDAKGVFRNSFKSVPENIQAARFANKLFHATGRGPYRAMAEHAMRYLASDAVVEAPGFLTGVLLADREIGSDPLHLAVVGAKDDPKAKALYQAALGYPETHRRVEWWDRREGALPRADVDYPDLEQAAAFVCAERACSRPFLSPEQIGESIKILKNK